MCVSKGRVSLPTSPVVPNSPVAPAEAEEGASRILSAGTPWSQLPKAIAFLVYHVHILLVLQGVQNRTLVMDQLRDAGPCGGVGLACENDCIL